MNFNEWEEISSPINAQSDLDKSNVIDRIAEELKKQNEDIHKEWLQSKFNINHKFKVTSTKSEVIIMSTLLHIAAWNGHLEIVKCLIGKRAKVNAKDDYGDTPLHMAAENGHLNIVKYLVENGADPDVKDYLGNTLLHVAALKGRLEIVKYLIGEKKVDPNMKNNFGATPLHAAAIGGHLEIVKYFVDEKSVDPNIKNDCGNTPLHYAALNGHTDTVTALIEKGAKVDAVDELWCTSLHHAAQDGYTDTVEVLIRSRADVNKMDEKEGFTPLHLAVLNDHLKIVKALLGNKADPLLKNKYGKTSRDLAKNEEVRQILKEAEDKQRIIVNKAVEKDPASDRGVAQLPGDKTEDKQKTSKAIKTGSICSVIAALTVAIGCVAANVGLSISVITGIAIAVALVIGIVAGGIIYAVPNSKLNEPNVCHGETKKYI